MKALHTQDQICLAPHMRRIELDDQSSLYPNSAIEDKRLSLEAWALLMYILYLSEDGKIEIKSLMSLKNFSRKKIPSLLQELEKFDYLSKVEEVAE